MKLRMIFILLVAFLLLGVFSPARADPQAYDLSWWKVAGGGGNSQGGTYLLQGTAGQADAGTLSGGQYAVVGGFWAVLPSTGKKIFLPCVTKQ